MNLDRLIPVPQSIVVKEGTPFALRSAPTIGFNGMSLEAAANELAHEFGSLGISLSVKGVQADGAGISLELAESDFLLKRGHEAYELAIGSDGIVIRASHEAGLFYGTRTLLQLADKDGSFAPIEIHDWPEMPMRGVHFMLQGPIPSFAWFRQAISDLAACKINTILLEYEDKFPYQKHPALKHRQAFTPEQVAALVSEAERRHIQVIPLLQCLGHVEYILKHEEYMRLRERPRDAFQACPSNEDTFKLFAEMAAELMPFHKNAKYFHVGADETYFLGACGKCAGKARTPSEKAELYLGHLNKVCDAIVSHGKTPILWSDMLVDFPAHLPGLNKKAVVMYWDYTPAAALVPWVKWRGRAYLGEDIADEIPADIQKLFGPYWEGAPFPKLMNAFPYTRFFKEGGHEVIVAPIADQVQTFENITEFAGNARRCGALGAVTTSWPLFPAGHAWFGFLATADKTWNGSPIGHDFKARLAAAHFGSSACRAAAELPRLLNKRTRSISTAQSQAAEALEILDRLPPPLPRHGWLYRSCRTLATQRRYEAIRQGIMPRAKELAPLIRMGEWGDFIEDANFPEGAEARPEFSLESLADIVAGLKLLARRLAELEDEMKAGFGALACQEAVEDYFANAFAKDKEFIARWLPPLKLLLTARKLESVLRY